MIKVTDKQLKEMKKNIKSGCCNYDNGQCIVLDCECPQMITTSLCCKWYREAVLPDNKLLYADIYKSDDVSKCKMCGNKFVKTGNRQQYCPECAKKNRTAKKHQYNRENYLKNKG